MRIEGGAGQAIRLVASPRDLKLLDAAFPQLLEHVVFDDWLIRTGATRDEMVAVWAGVAGARPEPVPGEDLAALPISERAIEVLEATLFELARARAVPSATLEQRTGVPISEWLRVWRLAHRLVRDLQLGPVPGRTGESPAPPLVDPADPDSRALARFRQVGGDLSDSWVSGMSIELGDVHGASIERCRFRDVAARDVRLVGSHLSEVDLDGAAHGGAIIDCELDGVSVAGTVSSVSFIGNVCSLLDLRRATPIDCRFFETGPGDEILLPSGRDCFVIPIARVRSALEPAYARIGERTFDALVAWVGAEEAEFVSVGRGFWQREVVERGGDPSPEVEDEVVERLHRLRVVAIGGRPMLAADEPDPAG